MMPCNHNYELGKFLKEEDALDDRAEIASEGFAYRKAKLLDKDGSCYPWTVDNIFEALSNLSFRDQIEIASYLSAAEKLPENYLMQIMCSKEIRKTIVNYWDKMSNELAKCE